jgi:hypothetical protein
MTDTAGFPIVSRRAGGPPTSENLWDALVSTEGGQKVVEQMPDCITGLDVNIPANVWPHFLPRFRSRPKTNNVVGLHGSDSASASEPLLQVSILLVMTFSELS